MAWIYGEATVSNDLMAHAYPYLIDHLRGVLVEQVTLRANQANLVLQDEGGRLELEYEPRNAVTGEPYYGNLRGIWRARYFWWAIARVGAE